MIIITQSLIETLPYVELTTMMNADERAVFEMPSTWRHVLVTVSIAKRYLAEPDTPPEIAFRYLQSFDRLCSGEHGWSAAAFAVVEPACDDAHELYREAMKLVPKRREGDDMAKRCRDHQAAWRVIESWDTFAAFVSLNPSLLAAIKRRGRRWDDA
jgi:hypothetical protein